METCKYCAEELQFIGEHENEVHFLCSFCNLTFLLKDTSSNRKRKQSVPDYINPLPIFATTQEFLECDTVNLYYTLKEIRAFWYQIKSLLERTKGKLKDGQIPRASKEKPNKMLDELVKEYAVITKKKFVVENILLERTGYLPEKITEDFLNQIIEYGTKASEKPMYIYIK